MLKLKMSYSRVVGEQDLRSRVYKYEKDSVKIVNLTCTVSPAVIGRVKHSSTFSGNKGLFWRFRRNFAIILLPCE